MTKQTDVVWVREDVVLAVHLRQLAEHGGGEGIRDEGLLQSALWHDHKIFWPTAILYQT